MADNIKLKAKLNQTLRNKRRLMLIENDDNPSVQGYVYKYFYSRLECFPFVNLSLILLAYLYNVATTITKY